MTKTNVSSNYATLREWVELRAVAKRLVERLSGRGAPRVLSKTSLHARATLVGKGLLQSTKAAGYTFSGALQPCNWIAKQLAKAARPSCSAAIKAYRADGYSISQKRFFRMWNWMVAVALYV